MQFFSDIFYEVLAMLNEFLAMLIHNIDHALTYLRGGELFTYLLLSHNGRRQSKRRGRWCAQVMKKPGFRVGFMPGFAQIGLV